LVRQDLSNAQRAVQACHAVELWCDNYFYKNGVNDLPEVHTKVLLLVPNEDAIKLWQRKLAQRSIASFAFREPSIGNQKTAMSCCTDKHNIFSSLPMLE